MDANLKHVYIPGPIRLFVLYIYPPPADDSQQAAVHCCTFTFWHRTRDLISHVTFCSSGSEVSLQPFRTDMTLCVPNPTFTHETRHSLLLPSTHPVQRAVMRACGGSSGVPFELWRRFYYPNIRDQLIAKVHIYTINQSVKYTSLPRSLPPCTCIHLQPVPLVCVYLHVCISLPKSLYMYVCRLVYHWLSYVHW